MLRHAAQVVMQVLTPTLPWKFFQQAYLIYPCTIIFDGGELLRGRIDGFSLDALAKMLAFAGLRVQLRIEHTPGTRRAARRIPRPDARAGARPITGRREGTREHSAIRPSAVQV